MCTIPQSILFRADRVMNRRETLLGMLALCAPLRAFAQDGKVRRIGLLLGGYRKDFTSASRGLAAFRKAMSDFGYIDGRNLAIEMRFDENKAERVPALAVELVASKPEVIVVLTTTAARALQKATSTIPIVMIAVSDPIAAGLVKSLARPEAKISGMANFARDVSAKQLDLLLELVPRTLRIAVLWNPDNLGNRPILQDIQGAVQKLGKKLIPVEAREMQEIAPAFATMVREKAQAVNLLADPFLIGQQKRISELAIEHRLPSMGSIREQAARQPCKLRCRPHRELFARRLLRRPVAKGRQTERLADRATAQVRILLQPGDRESACDHDRAGAPREGGRGDRVTTRRNASRKMIE